MSDLLRLLAFPFFPATVAAEMRNRPRWLMAFVILASVTVATRMVLHPMEAQQTLAELPPSATPADRGSIGDFLDASLPVRIGFLPFRLLAGWSATALLLFVIVKVFRPVHPMRFVHMLALEIHSESANVIGLLIRGACVLAGVVTHTVPEGSPVSALTFTGGADDFIVRALLTSINLHTLWYIWVVGSGVTVICGFRKRKALFFTAVMWSVASGFNLAIIQVLRNVLHLKL